MTNQVSFTKMQGIGNDYIYVDTTRFPISSPHELAVRWSAPHTGIGSDGLVLIGSSEIADFSMRIFNADGSEAMMCGNASRCIGKYVYEKGLTDRTELSLETLSGIKHLHLHVRNGRVDAVTVDMGLSQIMAEHVPVDGLAVQGTAVSMGNPHLVLYVDDLSCIDLESLGRRLESHPLFPDRTNVEFVSLTARDEVRMRVWERGSGLTMACGTGACATAVAGVACGHTARRVRVCMDGGQLDIEVRRDDGHVWMTGPAAFVFEGSIEV